MQFLNSACRKTITLEVSWTAEEKKKAFTLLLTCLSVSFSLCLTLTYAHTQTQHIPSPSLDLSHTPLPLWGEETTLARGEGEEGGIMGNVSRHMSKVQPVYWKSCVWCDIGPPAANPAAPPPLAAPPPSSDSVQPTEKLPVFAPREKESKRKPAGRVISTTPLG